MIKGDLYYRHIPPNQDDPVVAVPFPSTKTGVPIWRFEPWIDVELEIPRLSVKKVITMLVDTGADGTLLSVRDGLAAFGESGYHLLQQSCEADSSIGIGGSSSCFKTDAKVILQHNNGMLEGYSFELAITKPEPKRPCIFKGLGKLGLQLRIPSVLGRDILCEFRLVMDYSKHELSLDH